MEPHSAPKTASDESEKQEALVAAFTAGSVVGAPYPITRVDTHLSHVFLTGDRPRAMSLFDCGLLRENAGEKRHAHKLR